MSLNLCLLADMHLFHMNTRHMSAPYRMSLLSTCAEKIRAYLAVFSMELCLSHQLIIGVSSDAQSLCAHFIMDMVSLLSFLDFEF